MRRWKFRLTCGLLLSLALFSAGAEVTLDAWIGSDRGYIRSGALAPVHVLVLNDDTERQGRVVASLRTFTGEIYQAVRSIELPPMSRKAVFVYIFPPAQSPDELIVTLETGQGRVIATYKQRVQVIPGDLPVIGLLGGNVIPGMPPLETGSGYPNYTRLQIQLDHLPDRAEGLAMYDALILSPLPYQPLGQDRLDALREWVLRGGQLIIDVSRRTDQLRSEPFQKLLPVTVETEVQAYLDVLSREAVFTRATVDTGKVLLESNDYPLIVQSNRGLGSITCLMTPPDLLANLPGSEFQWRTILSGLELSPDQTLRDTTQALNEVSRDELKQLVQTAQRTSLRFGIVLLLTGLYALAVGPGDYLFVRRMGKPKLTWITFPVIVFVFTALSYFGARAWIGGDLATQQAERLLILPEESTALRFAVAGVFAPQGRSYDIQSPNAGLLHPIRPLTGIDGQLVIDNDQGGVRQRIPIWQWRHYVAAEIAQSYPDIAISLGQTPHGLEITVRNGTEFALTGLSAVYGNQFWRIPNTVVTPGETVTLDLPWDRMLPAAKSIDPLNFAGVQYFGTPWAPARELDIRQALERGALILFAREAGAVPTELTIDGDVQAGLSKQSIAVLVYPGDFEQPATREEQP